jgi:hypothetical protein
MNEIIQFETENIVNEIFKHLGGKKFTTMTGAKLSYLVNKELQPELHCKLPGNIEIKNKINLFIVAYNSADDLYNITFKNTRRNQPIVRQLKGVFAIDLIQNFEKETGLLCRL